MKMIPNYFEEGKNIFFKLSYAPDAFSVSKSKLLKKSKCLNQRSFT